MKRFLLSTLVLSCFAISTIAIQISCNKTIDAQTSGSTPSAIGKIIYRKVVTLGTGYTSEIWIANYDGTNTTKVNIVLPSGVYFDDGLTLAMSPNAQKIFFTAGAPDAGYPNVCTNGDLYSCNVDGSGLSKIIDKGGITNRIQIGNAY
jgi:hypothetical protein